MNTEQLVQVPRLRTGFRRRGGATTRLEGFVDAAFAFAVTLLVISVDSIPDTLAGLVTALKGVPAFAASFAMVAMFWSVHARWSRHYGLDDTASTLLSLLLVFLVLVYVYPLKLLYGTFFAWLTDGWLPMPLRDVVSHDDITLIFVIYGMVFVTLSLLLAVMFAHAWRQRGRLGLDATERDVTAGDIAQFLWFGLVGVLSVSIAIVMPARGGWLSAMPGMTYMLLAFTGVASHVGVRWARSRAGA